MTPAKRKLHDAWLVKQHARARHYEAADNLAHAQRQQDRATEAWDVAIDKYDALEKEWWGNHDA